MTPREFLNAMEDDAERELRRQALAEVDRPNGVVHDWLIAVTSWARGHLVRIRGGKDIRRVNEKNLAQPVLVPKARRSRRIRTTSNEMQDAVASLIAYHRGEATPEMVKRLRESLLDENSEVTKVLTGVTKRRRDRADQTEGRPQLHLRAEVAHSPND